MTTVANSALIASASTSAQRDLRAGSTMGAGLVSAITAFFTACGEGLAAHRRYEALCKSGVPATRAAEIALGVYKAR